MELRKNTPWRIFARPILRAHEFVQFESPVAAKLMCFEIIHFYMLAIERSVVSLFVYFSIRHTAFPKKNDSARIVFYCVLMLVRYIILGCVAKVNLF